MKNYKNELIKLLKNDRTQIDVSNLVNIVKSDLRKNYPLDDICQTLVYVFDENIEYLKSLRNKIEKIGDDYQWDKAMLED